MKLPQCITSLLFTTIILPVNAQANPVILEKHVDCSTQLERRGIPFNSPNYRNERFACEELNGTKVRAGAFGIDPQVFMLCRDEMKERGLIPGVGRFQEDNSRCHERLRTELANPSSAPNAPFGHGEVQNYMNSLHNDDINALVAEDKKYSGRMGQRDGHSVLPLIMHHYLRHYHVAYKECLGANAKVIKGGGVYKITKRDRYGNETSRTSDERRYFPVKDDLFLLDKFVGLGDFDPMHDQAMRFLE